MSSAAASRSATRTRARCKASRPKLTNSALLAAPAPCCCWRPSLLEPSSPGPSSRWKLARSLLLVAWGVRQWINHQLEVSNHVLYLPMAAFFVLAVMQWMTGATAYRHVTYTHVLLYAAYGMLAFVVDPIAAPVFPV